MTEQGGRSRSRPAGGRRSRVLVRLVILTALVLMAACGAGGGEGDEADSETDVGDVEGEDGEEEESDEEGEEEDDALTGGDPILREFSLPVPLFAADSAWNQRADTAAVLRESEEQILSLYRQLVGDRSMLVPGDEELNWPFTVINYDAFTYPIFPAGDGTQDVLIRDYDGVLWYPSPMFPESDSEGGPVRIPGPVGPVRPAGPTGTDSDGHLVLVDLDTGTHYDLWQATTGLDDEGMSLGGGLPGPVVLEAGALAMFDLDGPGANPPGLSSARAMGPPLLAGLLLPEDVEAGVIAHALSFAIPGPRNLSDDQYEPLDSDWFYPASTTETDFFSTDPAALTAGQRIRLKSSLVDDAGAPIDESEFAPITRMFLRALREYGAYLIDASGGFTFGAEDIHTADLGLSAEEVNELAGRPADADLPEGKTAWQVVMEVLGDELQLIPVGSGPWWEYGPDGRDPSEATFGVSNWEVVEPTTVPTDFDD